MSTTTTTLGHEIFRSRNISDIRHQLERKAITCALIGGSSPEHLPIPIQINDELLRYAYHLVRIVNEPRQLSTLMDEVGDVIRHCYMDGASPILTESPLPIFGEDDLHLLVLVDQIEKLETKAMRGGILL